MYWLSKSFKVGYSYFFSHLKWVLSFFSLVSLWFNSSALCRSHLKRKHCTAVLRFCEFLPLKQTFCWTGSLIWCHELIPPLCESVHTCAHTHVLYSLIHRAHIYTLCVKCEHEDTKHVDHYHPHNLFMWRGGSPGERGCVNALSDACVCVSVCLCACVCVLLFEEVVAYQCVCIWVWGVVGKVSPLPCPLDTAKFILWRGVVRCELASKICCCQHWWYPCKTFKFRHFGFALSVKTLL